MDIEGLGRLHREGLRLHATGLVLCSTVAAKKEHRLLATFALVGDEAAGAVFAWLLRLRATGTEPEPEGVVPNRPKVCLARLQLNVHLILSGL